MKELILFIYQDTPHLLPNNTAHTKFYALARCYMRQLIQHPDKLELLVYIDLRMIPWIVLVLPP